MDSAGRRPGPASPAVAGAVALVMILGAAAVLLHFLPEEPEPIGSASLTLAEALTGGDTSGFARVRAPRELVFPEDHGPHPEYRTEWWYFTGNLFGADGRRFGYQLTLFRNALSPDPPAVSSPWATNEIFMGHFAVTDVQGESFHGAERFARRSAGLSGAEIRPLRIWLEGWSIEEVTGPEEGEGAPSSIFPLRIRAAEAGVALELTLEAGKPIVLQGDRGYSRKGAEQGNASFYYSFTRLPSSGTVTIDGETLVVSGESWLDREWGTSALGEDQVGWDWFALQLDDGTELMLYQLRRADGSTDPFSRGTFVGEEGGSRGLAREAVALEVRARWSSPRGGSYPARWRLRIPELELDLDVLPVLSDQEHDAYVRYWEGAVDVAGTRGGRRLTGRGYVELTGYADDEG